MSFDELKQQLFDSEDVKSEFDALSNEALIAQALIAARTKADLSQQEVAERMRTAVSAVARMESGSSMPSFNALERYASAIGQPIHLDILPMRQVT